MMTDDDEFSTPREETPGIGAARRLGAPVATCDQCRVEFLFDEGEAIWVRFWRIDGEENGLPSLVCSYACASVLSTHKQLDGMIASTWVGDDLRSEDRS